MTRTARYPWDEIISGEEQSCKPEEEYGTTPDSFRRYLIGKANKLGIKVSTTVEGQYVRWQFYKPEA